MTFQSTVRRDQAGGVVGEIIFGGPHRANSGILQSTDEANNVVGRAFKLVDGTDNTYSADIGAISATNPFVGILVNPKVYALRGEAPLDTLAPSITLPNAASGEFLTMGTIIVTMDAAASIGNDVYASDTNGTLTPVAVGDTPPSGYSQVPNAKVTYRNTTGAGDAIITLTN